MMRTEGWNGLESAPRWIISVTGAYMLLGLLTLYVWCAAAPAIAPQTGPDGAEALSVTAMAAVQAWLCLLALRCFEPRAPMRRVWLLLMLSAASRVVGGLLAQVLGTPGPLNPLATGSSRIEQMHRAALILDGPVQMALLAVALLLALFVLRRQGFGVRPHAAGWAVAGLVVLFTACRFSTKDLISLSQDAILCVLAVEGMLLWRSAVSMGRGLVARCWRALAVGVFIIGFGEAALWAAGHYAPAWLIAPLGWYVWFPTAAVLALAPARCVAAVRRATGRAARPVEHLRVVGFPRTAAAR